MLPRFMNILKKENRIKNFEKDMVKYAGREPSAASSTGYFK